MEVSGVGLKEDGLVSFFPLLLLYRCVFLLLFLDFAV